METIGLSAVQKVEKCYKDRLNECFEKMFKQEHSKHDRSYSTQQSLLLHIELGGHITKTLLSPGRLDALTS